MVVADGSMDEQSYIVYDLIYILLLATTGRRG